MVVEQRERAVQRAQRTFEQAHCHRVIAKIERVNRLRRLLLAAMQR